MMPTERRSDRTKAAILAAARERFAAEGYDRATIRGIAAEAGIDPSMVMRYYGSKVRLFAAATEFDLRLPPLAELGRDRAGVALVAHFLDRWEGDEGLLILLRAGVTNAQAAQRMQDIFARQLVPVAAALCPDPAAAPVRAGLAATQVLGMALCRYVLELPPVAAMERAEIIDWLGPTLQRYLTGER